MSSVNQIDNPDTEGYSYTVSGAEKNFGLSRSHLFLAMKSGELPYKKAGRTRIILGEHLRARINALPDGDLTEAAQNVIGQGGES